MSSSTLPFSLSLLSNEILGDKFATRRPLGDLSVNTTPAKPGKSKMTPSTNTAPIQSIRSSSCETCDARERTKKPLDKEQEISSIFRSSPVVDEEEDSDSDDLMALKRATPVFDVDDESPFKRLRRTSSFDEEDERDESDEVRVMSNMLSWSDVLVEGDNGYSVASIMRAR